jgi:zinc protease
MRPLSLLARASVLAVCLAAAAPSHAADEAKAKPLKLPELKYETYTLPNGLKVITHEDHRLPLVAVDLWYHVGPLNEKAGRTGFAHLFEHMMFEGSEHVGEKAHIKFVEGAGATDVNGTTDFDRTNYFETMPANQLELALWLESDRMGFLLEGLDRVKLANQRDVVRNERRQGEGSPYDLAEEEVFHQLFPAAHPYYPDVIGSHRDIEAARINDLRDFHQQFYTPNNASIAIAGDFNPAQLKELLAKYFGPIPAGPKVEPVSVVTPPITTQKRATVTDTVVLPRLTVAFLMPPAYTPGDADSELLANILGGSKASRLRQAMVYKTQVAQSISCYDNSLKLTGIFECDITAKPNVKLEDLESTFWAEVAKLQTAGPTAAELDAARTLLITRKISGLQRLGGFGGVADTLDQYNQYTGDPGYLPKDVARYQAITPASLQAIAAKYLNKNQAVVVSCVPGKKVVDDVPRSPDDTDANVKLTPPYTPEFEASQNWRKTVPSPGPALSFHLPVPTEFTLKNGLKVYLVHDANLPIVSAQLVTRAGGETNPGDKPGLASFTAGLLTEGTATRSALEVAEAAEALGTSLGVNAGMDSASASVSVLASQTGPALDLLADVIRHPAFNPPDVERIRKLRVTGIQQESDSPFATLFRVGPRLLYGDTPYGFATSGTKASLESITIPQLQSFWSSHYGPADSALVFAGDLTEAEARGYAEHAFGDWSGSAQSGVTLPPPPAPPTTHIVIVDKPGAPQTALAALGIGIPRTSPQLQAIEVMNYTLGGSFGSRINMNLREEHGYTYGAQSAFFEYREGGPFFAGGLVRTDVTAPSAQQLTIELRRILTDPPTPAELKMAKDASIQSIPGTFETMQATAGQTGELFVYNRPLDYYATLPDRYRAVTPEAVVQAAQTTIHPDNLLILCVGDKGKIEPALKQLNLAPITYADPLGNVIPQ